MNVRKGLPDDAKAIATIHVRAWQSAYRGIIPSAFLEGLSISQREDAWRQHLISGETTIFVAEESGQVVGWAQLGRSRDTDADRSTGELYAIHVAPEHWRHGVGQHLWSKGVVHLRQSEYAEATLWVIRDNAGACAFYRANGFVADVGIQKTLRIAGSELVEIRLRHKIGG
jgi:ribosomal protein S18 acetylase RimI-like enzyme